MACGWRLDILETFENYGITTIASSLWMMLYQFWQIILSGAQIYDTYMLVTARYLWFVVAEEDQQDESFSLRSLSRGSEIWEAMLMSSPQP